MTIPSEGDALEREIRINARPETIFPFLADPEKMMKWKGMNVELDPRPGGIYRVNMNGSSVVRGEYVEVTPYSRVVFTWGWEGDEQVPPGSSTVEIELIPHGSQTTLRLRHLGLDPEQRKTHDEGWAHYMERLVVAGGGGDPGPDPWAA